MRIPAVQQPLQQQNPRFASAAATYRGIPATGFTALSQWALTRYEVWANAIANSKRLAPGVKGPLAWFVRNFLDQDYREMASLPKLGKVVAEPPMGALALLLFGFTLGGRVDHALKRAKEGDYREIRDICVRDLTTFVLILFALKPIVKGMSKWLENINGIELVKPNMPFGEGVYGFSDLSNMYRVVDPNSLVRIWSNPKNHKGMLQAIDKAMKNPALKPVTRNLMEQYRSVIAQGIAIAEKHQKNPAKAARMTEALGKMADKAFNVLQRLEARYARDLAKTKTGAYFSENLFSRMGKFLVSRAPAASEIFSHYARGARVWSVVVANLIQVLLLGFGVTAFNQWFTEREYQKKLAELKARQQQQNNMFNPAMMMALQGQPAFQGRSATYPGTASFRTR